MTPSWYDVLEVDPDASPAEIRAAWKAGVVDLDPTDRRFRLLNKAAEVLLDEQRRLEHDRALAADAAADARAEEAGPEVATVPVGEPDLAASETPVDAEAPPAEDAVVLARAHHGPGPVTTGVLGLLAVLLLVATVVSLVAGGAPSAANDTASDALPDAREVAAARAAAEAAIVPVLCDDYRQLEQDKQAAIFEAFSQADQTTTRRYGGTGLGLAISRRLVEAMSGDIGLVSKPGKGSRFFFTMKTKMLAPPRAVRRTKEDKRAIIAIDGDATPKMLAHYLRESGVMTTIVEQDAEFGALIACADMIFASPTFYHAYQKSIEKGRAQWIPARVCICELGDTAPDTLVENGVVEDILLAPLSRREVMEQIERVFDARLRGKAALAGAEPPSPSYPTFRGQRVLAADDSAVNREVVKEALARLNLEPTLANDGREAVRLAQAGKFDLILMDCSMPEMDGYEATHAIRALEKLGKLKPTPIIALSAHVAGKEDAWRSAGMNDYLTKPFTLETLAAVLGKHLEAGGGEFVRELSDAATAIAENPVFDRAVMDQIAAIQSSGADLPLRTLNLFEEHSRKAMRDLIEALKTGNGSAVTHAAHALKSMSANIGAVRLAAACGALERAAADGESAAALARLGKTAASEFREAHKMLPRLMAKYKRSAA